MTASAATIRQIRTRFEKALKDGGADIDVVDSALYGGTPSAITIFRSIATKAGRAVGPGSGEDFEKWLDLLRTRTELREEGFVEAVQSVRSESQDIPLSQIDPPPNSSDAPKRASNAGAAAVVQRVREALKADRASKVDRDLLRLTSARRQRLEERIRAALLLEMMDYSNSPDMPARMVVSKGSHGRYTVALTHLPIYEAHRLLGKAYIALGHSTVLCAVQPTGWVQRLHIHRAYQASITLCKLLEADAPDEEQEDGTSVNRPMPLAPSGPVQKEALSVKEFAKIIGVHEDTIRRKIHRREIQMVKIGRLIRIPWTEVSRLHSLGKPAEGSRRQQKAAEGSRRQQARDSLLRYVQCWASMKPTTYDPTLDTPPRFSRF